jgi:2-dehydro-3-deoxyphosphogluconate aldolase / (4S)-4-hydroxy-2-oxoglutarate aldolase
MARFTQEAVIKKIGETKLLPLFNYADAEVCKQIIKSSYHAGLRAFELTNRDTFALEVFKQLVPWVEKECPELSFGAGTILEPETAESFIDAGADFIISPVYDKDVAKACKKRNIPWIPGCFSPTELYKAARSGAALVKLFPAGTVGPEYVKNVLAPLPFIRIMITGGVKFDEASVKSWLEAGVFAMGIGSSVFTRERVTKKDYASIEEDIKKIVKYTR